MNKETDKMIVEVANEEIDTMVRDFYKLQDLWIERGYKAQNGIAAIIKIFANLVLSQENPQERLTEIIDLLTIAVDNYESEKDKSLS